MLASLQMPESTFNIVYLPLIGSIRSLGSMIALIGLTVMIFTIVIWVFSSMIRREKELAAKMAEERMNHTGGYGFYRDFAESLQILLVQNGFYGIIINGGICSAGTMNGKI